MAQQLLFFAATAFTAYHLLKLIYNVYFHPLRHIPGPWLSAGTYLPELYYDVLRSGLYTKQIQKMHEKYGERRIAVRNALGNDLHRPA